MEKTNLEIMHTAKEALNGKWGIAVGTFLVYTLLTSTAYMREEWLPFTSIIFIIIAGPLLVGVSMFSLNIARDCNPQLQDVLEGFKRNAGNAIITYLLMALFIVLWMLLFIIPGIIAAISYSMTFFILAEDEHTPAMEALDKSKQLMDGYKWKYFRLGLRLFGLALLCILTLGIGFLFLIPYAHVCNAKFYEDVKANQIINDYKHTIS